MKVSIIIPAYNEEQSIPILLKELQDMILTNKLDCEVIIVDDGSDDRTYDVAENEKKNYPNKSGQVEFIKVIKHRRNFGKTEAILSGFEASSGEVLVLMDADLQYSPASIPKLIDKMNEGFDVVAGWKVGKYEKQFVSSIYNLLSRWLFKIPVHDQNAIKILRREVLENINLRKDWHRYIVALACDKGYHAGEIKVELYPRRYGKSKYRGAGRTIIGIFDLIAVKFQISLMKKPLLLFGTLGGVLLIAGFIVGLIALYQRFILQHGFRPMLYLVILLIIIGILFFILGFLAESVAAIHEELKSLKKNSP